MARLAETSPTQRALSSDMPITIAGMMVRDYYCKMCGAKINGFRDRLSAKEFAITHTCQSCQDWLFGERKED